MQLHYQNWYDLFLAELSKTNKLRVISPFVTEQMVRNIQERIDFNSFELITRYNLQDFALGLSSLTGLKFAVESGAKIYGVQNLHSKIYLFDERSAIISSANMTRGGMITNYECGLHLTDSQLISELHRYFNHLRALNAEPLTLSQCDEWLNRINSIVIPNTPVPSLPDFGATPIAIERDRTYFIKILGKSSNRVPLSHTTRKEIEGGLCHYACGFSENKKPKQVSTGDVVFMARLTRDPNNYAIFGKAYAIKYVEGRDRATDNEIRQRPWKKDWPNYLRVTDPVFIDGTMGDCVLLYDLIQSMDYLSFPSTQRRYLRGDSNINPYRSLRQRAIIPLTPQAAQWLVPRFDECLNRIGQVPNAYIASLPQSDTQLA